MTELGTRNRLAIRSLGAAALPLLLLLALAFLDRPGASRPPFGDEITYRDAAVRLEATGAADLDPLWPPLYPYFLAGLLAPAGGSLALVRAAQVLLLLAAAFLLADLARRVTGVPAAAPWAAFLLLADPQVAAFAFDLWPEILHLFLFLAAVWALVRASREPRGGWLLAATAGLCLGLALLTKSLLGPFLPFLLAPLLLAAGWRRGLARAGLVLLVLAATVAPALWTNHLKGNGWVIADSSRFNLWVGLNDTSRRNLVGEIVGDEYAVYRQSAPTLPERNRILEQKIGALAARRGWAAIVAGQLGRQPFRLFDKDSFLTDRLPGGALAEQGYGYRAVPPALATVLRLWSYLLYGLVLAAAGAGMALLVRRQNPWRRGLLLFLAYNLALFLFLHVKARYRVQILPVLDLYAAVALAAWSSRGALGEAVRPRLGKGGWAMAVAVSATLLFWAFGGGLLPGGGAL